MRLAAYDCGGEFRDPLRSAYFQRKGVGLESSASVDSALVGFPEAVITVESATQSFKALLLVSGPSVAGGPLPCLHVRCLLMTALLRQRLSFRGQTLKKSTDPYGYPVEGIAPGTDRRFHAAGASSSSGRAQPIDLS